MVDYSFVYELMRAYEGSNLLVNKRVIGGRVSEFIDLPDSYRQTVIDDEGNRFFYQYFEFKVPQRYKREKKIEEYLKKIEEKFQGKLLEVTDREIEHYNQYWSLPFVGRIRELDDTSCAVVEKPDGSRIIVSTKRGKEMPDVFETLFKPLVYF